jgi:LPS sulfotransferase NodH
VLAWRSYLACSVQRAGGWLLGHALEDTAVLGRPGISTGAMSSSGAAGWCAASDDAFLRAVQREPVTPNGVCGSKMMWNYLDDAVGRLRLAAAGCSLSRRGPGRAGGGVPGIGRRPAGVRS